MAFKVTFETAGTFFEARMSRRLAIDWLTSRGFTGMARGAPTNPLEPLASLSDDDLARMLGRATMEWVAEKVTLGGTLAIRHEPDDEPTVYASVAPTAVTAVVARPVPDFDDEDDDDEELDDRGVEDDTSGLTFEFPPGRPSRPS